MKIIYPTKKPPLLNALLAALAKNLIIKPSLKLQRFRTSYPKFWTMPYDSVCKEILIEGLYEKSVLDAMCQLVHDKNCTVLDVGANIGNHSVWFSKIFDNVVSFEPSERNGWIFKANIELNNITNIRLIQKGLSDTAGFIELNNDHNKLDTNNGFDQDKPFFTSKQTQQMIEIGIGDSEIAALTLSKQIGMIKVDVEGHEPQVIKGLAATIKKHRPIIYWEAFTPDTVNESKKVLEQFGLKYFYHLSPARPQGRFAKIKSVFEGRNCTLVPMHECHTFSGMNVGSFTPID